MMRMLLVSIVLNFCTMMATAQSLPYQNASLSAEQRGDDLLG